MSNFIFAECDILEITQGETTDVVATTNDGDGDGFDTAFVVNTGNAPATITYTINAVNNEVKFMKFVAKVWNVQTIKVFVLDENNDEVAPINPRNVPVSGQNAQDVEVRLLGTAGVKLQIVVVPRSTAQAKLDDVTIEACYTSGIVLS